MNYIWIHRFVCAPVLLSSPLFLFLVLCLRVFPVCAYVRLSVHYDTYTAFALSGDHNIDGWTWLDNTTTICIIDLRHDHQWYSQVNHLLRGSTAILLAPSLRHKCCLDSQGRLVGVPTLGHSASVVLSHSAVSGATERGRSRSLCPESDLRSGRNCLASKL